MIWKVKSAILTARLLMKSRTRVDLLPRKQKDDCYQQIFKGRNSFLKTYPDATFMLMKKGPMRNDQLKPGYNLQIATNNQCVLHYDLFSDLTGSFTLMLLLNSINLFT